MNKLYVITTVFNPCNYQSRYNLYQEFKTRIHKSGAILYTAELIFEGQDFVVTDANDPTCLQLKTTSPLWYKENLINLMIKKLPKNAKYIAWIDCDIEFLNADWVNLTIKQLKKTPIVQMFKNIRNLDKNNNVIPELTSESFIYAWIKINDDIAEEIIKNKEINRDIIKPRNSFLVRKVDRRNLRLLHIAKHPGFAYASTKNTLKKIGGILDYGILGSGDLYFASSLIGAVEKTFYPGMNQNYKNVLLNYQDLIIKVVDNKIGYVDNDIIHYWHGEQKKRKYGERAMILSKHNYDPTKDLLKDYQGLWILDEMKDEMKDEIFEYFKQRDEDE